MKEHPALFSLLRDIILLTIGCFMFVHETLGPGRWEVMVIGLVLVGLVPALRLDDLLKR